MFLFIGVLVGCESHPTSSHSNSSDKKIIRSENIFNSDGTVTPFIPNEAAIASSFTNQAPEEWGENVSGVKTAFQTDAKEVALTFDACGGPTGSEIDNNLISFLKSEEIPSTLFVNSRWIDENTKEFIELAENPLFQIENHGTEHKPLSVTGASAWGIKGTTSIKEVVDEILNNHNKITQLTGQPPSFFRSGTAYYDDVSVSIANELGIDVVNYTILGDAGATYSSDQVKEALLTASPGDIALLHMNQPDSGTAQGIRKAIPLLKEKGFTFVQLSNQNLR